MADENATPPQNGGPNADAPQLMTIAQYVKDLSVENPNAPKVYQFQGQPQIDVGFNIAANPVSEGVHEVLVKIEASAKSEEGPHFMIDLTYAGLYGYRNIAEEQLHPFFYVEAPTMLFPFARQVIADAVQQMGFAPLLLDMIDFRGAYMQQLQAQQAAPAPNGNGQADA